MNLKTRIWALLLTITLLGVPIGPAVVAGEAAQLPSDRHVYRLTTAQIENAIVIHRLQDLAALALEHPSGQVFKLSACDTTKPELPCYLTINHGQQTGRVQPSAVSYTYVCGKMIYNGLGMAVAKLQQNVAATFAGTITLNYGHLGGTSAWGSGYSWTSLSGPTPSPGWGTPGTGPAYAVSGGNLFFNPMPPFYNYSIYVTTFLTIHANGSYSCS